VAAAAYLRVSSASQTLESQRSAIQIAARARGIPIRRWYTEKASGGTLRRPELERLREAVRRGEVGCVFVFRLDRLTRTGIRDTIDVVDEFKRAGAELVSIADGFDVAGAAAEVVLAVLAWAARMERLALSERVRAARARIERQGGAWGRPPRMTRAQLERARELVAQGKSIRDVSIALKVPKSTLHAALSRKGIRLASTAAAAKQGAPRH
jgi:DNA invertase Pin-like site-specific DNA recombinase